MTVSTKKSEASRQPEVLHEVSTLTAEHDEEIRALHALGVLLESRLIDQVEYERRMVIYKKPERL